MFTDEGAWAWENFADLLPEYALLHIAAIKPPVWNTSADKPCWIWEWEPRREFNVKSAYKGHSMIMIGTWRTTQAVDFVGIAMKMSRMYSGTGLCGSSCSLIDK
ncbi:hypothetical protein V6N13_087576 [Hibiscus sabdariffa]|uniref:Uncharacterized protein n=1 Tax=Hibiscus sabdariffa TaxID=183260 RepID=A0ABR2FWN9_9ROSI